jgi:hypothetical protein
MTLTRTRTDSVPLSVSWEAEVRQWVQWARTPGHDSYWRFHRDQFLRLLPSPGRQTLSARLTVIARRTVTCCQTTNAGSC